MITFRAAGTEYLIDGETLTQILMLIFIFTLLGVLISPLF